MRNTTRPSRAKATPRDTVPSNPGANTLTPGPTPIAPGGLAAALARAAAPPVEPDNEPMYTEFEGVDKPHIDGLGSQPDGYYYVRIEPEMVYDKRVEGWVLCPDHHLHDSTRPVMRMETAKRNALFNKSMKLINSYIETDELKADPRTKNDHGETERIKQPMTELDMYQKLPDEKDLVVDEDLPDDPDA